MPKRIVKKPIVVYRDGKQVVPEVGTVFDFTEAELKDINKLQPKAIGHIVTADEPVSNAKAETKAA
jgi:hypothetical protein